MAPPRGRRQRRDGEAGLQEAVHDQARALLAGHEGVRCQREGDAARRARTGRDDHRRGRARRRDRRLVHVGREQSGPSGVVQPLTRDGL